MRKVCGLIIYVTLSVLLTGGCVTDYNALGVKLFNQGRFLDACEAFEKGYRLDPESAFSLNNIGYVYEMRDKDYEKAMEFYRKALMACSRETIDQSTSRKITQGPLEKLIRKNLERVWIQVITHKEDELHVSILRKEGFGRL